MIATVHATLARLRRSTSGLALLEFAFGLPVVLTVGMTGAESANWITVKMRVSQVALHLADNAARMGEGTQMQAKTISELTINDALTGAGIQAGDLNLYARGRVMLSDLEPAANPNTNSKYYIRWQRCRGSVARTSSYGTPTTPSAAPASVKDGMGPNSGQDRRVIAMDNSATMFVEVYYNYAPLISDAISPSTSFTEIASMAVRDRRDLSDDNASGATATHPYGVYKVSGVTASTC